LGSSFPPGVNDELKLSLRQSAYTVQLGLTGYNESSNAGQGSGRFACQGCGFKNLNPVSSCARWLLRGVLGAVGVIVFSIVSPRRSMTSSAKPLPASAYKSQGVSTPTALSVATSSGYWPRRRYARLHDGCGSPWRLREAVQTRVMPAALLKPCLSRFLPEIH
jgi:hypothetical protein